MRGQGPPPRPGRRSGSPRATAPFALLSLFAGGPREVAALRRRRGDSDRRPYRARVFGAARHLRPDESDNAATIRALGADPPPAVREAFARATDADWTSRGHDGAQGEAFAPAYDAFRRAVTLNSRNTAALAGLVGCRGGRGQAGRGARVATALAARDPGNAAVRIELSRVLAVTGDAPGPSTRRPRRCG